MNILEKEASIEIKNLLHNKDNYNNVNNGLFLFKVGIVGSFCRMSIPVTILSLSFTTFLNKAFFLTGLALTTSVLLFELSNICDHNFKKRMNLSSEEDILFVLKKVSSIGIDNNVLNEVERVALNDIKDRKLSYLFWKGLLNVCKKYDNKLLNIKINEDKENLRVELKKRSFKI